MSAFAWIFKAKSFWSQFTTGKFKKGMKSKGSLTRRATATNKNDSFCYFYVSSIQIYKMKCSSRWWSIIRIGLYLYLNIKREAKLFRQHNNNDLNKNLFYCSPFLLRCFQCSGNRCACIIKFFLYFFGHLTRNIFWI